MIALDGMKFAVAVVAVIMALSDVASASEMRLTIDGVNVPVQWADNESVKALKDYAPLMAELHMYGGFEQVGLLGMDLPRNDTRITTEPGDIMLYSGNQIVIFFEANTWEYTRLGKITGKSQNELESLLKKPGVVITIE